MGEGPATVRVRDKKTRYYAAIAAATVLGAGVAVGTTVAGANAAPNTAGSVAVPKTSPASTWTFTPPAATPIKHLVVLFDENVSFDHYFGTYPFAANTDGTNFQARRGTPAVNGLYTKITLEWPGRAAADQQPERVQPHPAHPLPGADLRPEPRLHRGAEGRQQRQDGPVRPEHRDRHVHRAADLFGQPGLVMDYYDGNTVTGLWNYAQNYAMSDNNWDTTFGPSTPGALNLISGQTGNAYAVDPTTGAKVEDPGSVSPLNSAGLGTVYGDPDPAFDDCSDASHTSTSPLAVATGKNIGDLLNARNVSWGWFQGGFAPTGTNAAGFAVCGATHTNIGGVNVGRLLAAPQPVRVLQVDGQPQAPAAVLRGRHRAHRPGQPPVRPVRLLHHAQGRQHAGGELPEGGGVPGRAPGLLRPAGRADVPGEHDQPDREVQVLEEHRDRDRLRRLRRLVRPPEAGDRERLQHVAGRGDLLLVADDGWPASRSGAVTASGCRCW